MREIDLPTGHTAQMSIDLHNLPPPNESGTISFGKISFAESSQAVAMARKNGGHIVYGAIEMSQKMEDVIANHFFGSNPYPPEEKSFFKNEVLSSPQLTSQFKKELFKKIVNKCNVLEGKAKHTFYRGLDEISTWRNAFAHGKLVYDSKGVVILEYYANGHKILELNDQYWNLVEETFQTVQKQLDALVNQKLHR